MHTGTCPACQRPQVRLAPSTTECPCLVCEDCGTSFLDQGTCGMCGTPFADDEPWDGSKGEAT